MEKVETPEAPAAIGPYSQAVIAGSFVFVSGQLPIDPRTKKLVPANIEDQTVQVLENITAILKATHLSLQDVVRAEIYLKNIEDFAAVNAVYARYFLGPIQPARQTLQVARLPLDALIEISVIAHLPHAY